MQLFIDFINVYKWYFIAGLVITIFIAIIAKTYSKHRRDVEQEQEDESEEEQDEDEDDEYEDTYSFFYDCDNCGQGYDYEIPLKTTVEVFLKKKICEDCGCNTIQKIKQPKSEE